MPPATAGRVGASEKQVRSGKTAGESSAKQPYCEDKTNYNQTDNYETNNDVSDRNGHGSERSGTGRLYP